MQSILTEVGEERGLIYVASMMGRSLAAAIVREGRP